MDAMQFFQRSAGRWRSQRTTHHLPFRRAENGGSEITVETLTAADAKIAEICQMHEVDAGLACGGAFVSWDGAMAWDKEGEDHAGSTVFSLIPDADNPRRGKLLRERGYAEIVPVAGEYEVDSEEGLNLITEYDSMSIVERFWFLSPDVRLRSSTVKRFGGLSTATFCIEARVDGEVTLPDAIASPTTNSQPSYAICGW